MSLSCYIAYTAHLTADSPLCPYLFEKSGVLFNSISRSARCRYRFAVSRENHARCARSQQNPVDMPTHLTEVGHKLGKAFICKPFRLTDCTVEFAIIFPRSRSEKLRPEAESMEIGLHHNGVVSALFENDINASL